MSDLERKSPPAPNANGRHAPINLERQRKLRELIASHPQMAARRLDFKAGDVLVRENEIAGDAQAFLVVEGSLEERQERYLPGRGQVTETLFDVQPGEVAFVQSLIPEYAAQPAYTSVVVAADGYALLLQQEDGLLRQTAGIVAGEFRIRLKLLLPLWDMKRQESELRAKLDAFNTRMSNSLKVLAQTEGDRKTAEAALAETEERNRALSERIARLGEDMKRAHDEARQARERMREAVTAFDEERRHMQLRAKGEELYLDRLRRIAEAHGLPADALELTGDECQLLLGEESPDIALLRETAPGQPSGGARDWTASADSELDAAMDALVADRHTPAPVSPFRAETPPDEELPPTTLAATPERKRTGPPPLPMVVVGTRRPESPGNAPRIELDLDELAEPPDGMPVDESELIADEPAEPVSAPQSPPTLAAGTMTGSAGHRPPLATLEFEPVKPDELEIVGPPSSRRPQGYVMPGSTTAGAAPPTERLGSIEGLNPFITGTMPAVRPPEPVPAPPRPKPKR